MQAYIAGLRSAFEHGGGADLLEDDALDVDRWVCKCHALPVAGCYAQPEGWRSIIAKNMPNAARTMARHVQAHETHRVNADTLVARVGRLAVTCDGYQCLGCNAILSGSKRLSRAVNHVCTQAFVPQYRVQICYQARYHHRSIRKNSSKRQQRKVVNEVLRIRSIR